jgi:hypothetical protein
MDLDFVRKGTTAQRAETSCVDVDVRKGTTAQRAETSCVDVDVRKGTTSVVPKIADDQCRALLRTA